MEKIKVGPFIPMPVVPTVVVGTNVDGKPNYLAVGFVSGVNIKPPIIGISLNRKHYSIKGLLENETFSVNIPSVNNILETDYCGLVSGRSVDKSSLFTSFYGELESAPMIEEFPIVCECKYTGQKVDFAMDTIYFGEIIQAYVNHDLYKKGQPADILKINPLLTGLDRQYRVVGDSIGKTFSIGWDCVSNKQSNSESTDFIVINRSPKYTLYKTCDIQNNGVENAIQEIKNHAECLRAQPVEGPFVIRNEGLEPEAGIKVGFSFKAAVQGKGEIKEGKINGGRYAKCNYIGPYEKMSGTLSSLHEFIHANGFKSAGLVYEFYINDPSITPPEKLETIILIPVQRI
jgi:flavin reductase (DIM6/NTAB) family NADH-FMN oxidoreductase RutF/effector-binding domain-containing protein